jgi:RNA polymerase sigma factor (sigma-70 family)
MLADLRLMDEAAWRAVYTAHDSLVRHVIRQRAALSEDDEDDVAARTWASAVRGIGGFDGRVQIQTWLSRIATNAALNWHRQHRRHARLDDTKIQVRDHTSGPDRRAMARITLHRVLRLVAAPRFDTQRRAWEMNVMGYSSDEAAREIGLVSGQAAKIRAHRVRQIVQAARW